MNFNPKADNSCMGAYFNDVIFPVFMASENRSSSYKKTIVSSLRLFCEEEHCVVEDADFAKAQEFFNVMKKRAADGKYTLITVKKIMLSLRGFYNYLVTNKDTFPDLEDSYTMVNGNPFVKVVIDIPDKMELNDNDFVEMEIIDAILSLCNNSSLYVGICLAFQLCLRPFEIVSLTKEQFVYEPSANAYFLVLDAINEKGKTKRFLRLRDDNLIAKIQTQISMNTVTDNIIFGKGCKKITVHTLQKWLKDVVDNTDYTGITFTVIRNSGIKILVDGGVDLHAIADYCGVDGRWLSRFYNVPVQLIQDPYTLSKIKISIE